MSDTLNGYPVVGSVKLPDQKGKRPARLVLVERQRDESYVTALHCFGDSEWLWGHYFNNRSDAWDDLIDRMQRKY